MNLVYIHIYIYIWCIYFEQDVQINGFLFSGNEFLHTSHWENFISISFQNYISLFLHHGGPIKGPLWNLSNLSRKYGIPRGLRGCPQSGPAYADRLRVTQTAYGKIPILCAENFISISFQIEWDMIVMTVFLSIFLTKWNSIWFKIERKTVATIISHSFWKEMEI